MPDKYYHYKVTGMMIAKDEREVRDKILDIFKDQDTEHKMSTINIEIDLFAPTAPNIRIQDHDSSK